MKKLYLLLLCCCLLRPVLAQQTYWQQEVSYTIDVSLDDAVHTLDGFLKLQYTNHSPDTLTFIWFHLWPNAYKNDKTAFSEQLLQNGSTDFYFSGKEQRGYINRLDFRINNLTLKTEDHPQYIDIVKVYLPAPLLPGQQTLITTPFHVQLPDVFSRGGHVKHFYNITQWYPKPAVYDRTGWHPMPYLNQGEFYSEFGSFDVRITLPRNYVVAATGELQNEEELQWLQQRTPKTEIQKEIMPARNTSTPARTTQKTGNNKSKPAGNKLPVNKPPQPVPVARQPEPSKTLRYIQNNVHDFAWFAGKDLVVLYDTLQMPSGRIVKAYSFFSGENRSWLKSMEYLKEAVRFRSGLIGEYPYNVVSVVESPLGFDGGMEYPTITNISPTINDLEGVIEHEVGHNWFYGILGSNERAYPWMDEGFNTYYDRRYEQWKHGKKATVVVDEKQLLLDIFSAQRKDQPIATSSEGFTWLNYNLVSYDKTANWMEWMEDSLGRARFDSCMRQYYRQWQFKHPAPADFQQTLETASGRSLSDFFAALHQTGDIPPVTAKPKTIKPVLFYSLKDYKHVEHINIMPLIGYNMYDKFMVGGVIHNYNLPPSKFRFMVAPLYAMGSKQLNGLAQVGYTWYPGNLLQKVTIGIEGARFSAKDGIDSIGHTITGGFNKVVPSLRVTFRNKDVRSTVEKWLEWKTYIIGERNFGYKVPVGDSVGHPFVKQTEYRYLNQLTFGITDYRMLYPYDAELQIQQAKDFYRINATANYLFNYAKGGGMRIRVFAAKFGYIGKGENSLGITRFQPKMTAVRGEEDYTYSNYFIGRNEFSGFASQQIMNRDAALKLRYDLFSDPPVRTDNWIAAINLNTTLPQKLFPVKLPLRLFLDVGTYAESWKRNAEYGKFLYVGGLQVTLFNELLNIYMPLVYSKAMRDNIKTEKEAFSFWKRLSFSIDIQRFNTRKMLGKYGF